MKNILVALSNVTHIGTLDPSNKGNQGPSLEGLGVSFSKHPEAWSAIAKLGGNPWWRADLSDMKIIDGYRFVKKNKEDLVVWGQQEGLITDVQAFAVSYYDDELEDEVSMQFSTKEEAEDNLSIMDGSSLSSYMTWAPTAILVAAMGASTNTIGEPSFSALEDVATIWGQRNGMDGIWWKDLLSPETYSAPRGIIFPDSVAKVEFKPIASPPEPRRARSPG